MVSVIKSEGLQGHFTTSRTRILRKCVYLVRRDHFRSRDKDGGHTIRSVVADNPVLHANFTAVFYRTGVTADRSFTLQESQGVREEEILHFLLL